MFTVPEQYTNITKASLEAQLALFTAFTQKAYAHAEKVVELNIALARESFEESALVAKALISAKGPQEFLSLTTANAKPNAEKVVAYGRQLANIAAAAQAELTRDAEFQLAESRRKVTSLIDDVSKNAPAGTESALAMAKTAIGNANAGFDHFSKAAKQAAEVIEAKVTESVSTFSQTASKPTARAAKK